MADEKKVLDLIERAVRERWTGQVIDFRDRVPKEGLWWPYKGKAHFEKLVRNHLTNYIRGLTDP